jgi:ferritin-like metal-binding protein YciE
LIPASDGVGDLVRDDDFPFALAAPSSVAIERLFLELGASADELPHQRRLQEQLIVRPVLTGQIPTLETVMSKEKELKDLFLDTLKDIYFAEKKILSALPKMAKAARSAKLKAAFEKHMAETDGQVERLEQVFASIDESPKGKTCDAILGIIEEGKEIMNEYKGMPALDAGLLAAAQAVEHYEISRYGTLKTWANELGYADAVKLLDATLKEEKATDSALSQLAESEVNRHAETAHAA